MTMTSISSANKVMMEDTMTDVADAAGCASNSGGSGQATRAWMWSRSNAVVHRAYSEQSEHAAVVTAATALHYSGGAMGNHLWNQPQVVCRDKLSHKRTSAPQMGSQCTSTGQGGAPCRMLLILRSRRSWPVLHSTRR